MAIDQRDYYRDWWRKKTGYVERALFRMSFGDVKRAQHRRGWTRNFVYVGIFAAVVATVAIAKRLLR